MTTSISRIWAAATLMAGLVVALPAVAANGGGGEGDRRVAVVALDDGTDSGALMHTVSNLLDGAAYDVVAGERLADLLEERQAEPIPERIAAKFTGISNVIGEGVRSFFYKGNETVVDKLTPILDLGMGHPEVLARRPDFADQMFQAGVILVRAYINLEQREDAAAVAQLLARRLPGKEPSPSTAPPDIIRFFRKQRKVVADGGARVTIAKVGGDECTSYVNGSAVGGRTLSVAAGETYYLALECGGEEAPVWRRSFVAGEEATVPISAADPLDFAMENANYRERKRAEAHLQLVSEWTGISEVLGVKQPRSETDDESVLVVRVGAGGTATWSDATRSGEVNQAIARVMPGYEPSVPDEPEPAPGRQRGLDWTLAAGGTALLVGGTTGAVVTERRAHQVKCSTGAVGGCGGVTLLEFESPGELRQAEREVTTGRVLYIGGLAAGAGLATWGVWRLVRGGSGEKKKDEQALRVWPVPAVGGVSVRGRW